MKFVSLVSSGIDSPVATYLISRKKAEIILVHADNRPHTDDREIQKFILLAERLNHYIPGDLPTYQIPHGHTLSTVKQQCNPKYTCILCKRMLLRYAEKIAELESADAVVMGDSLGQVASQTLHNIRVIEQAIHRPVLRPLIGFDKEEITRIAKSIDTYELSILQSDECLAVPKKPSTRARLDDILQEEEKINVNDLVTQALTGVELLFS